MSNLMDDWKNAKAMAIKALEACVTRAETEEKALPKKPGPKTKATKDVKAGFSTTCRSIDTCCIAVDEAVGKKDKKTALRHLETFKNCWAAQWDSLKGRNKPENIYIRDELINLNKWITSKYEAWKKELGKMT